MARTYKIVQTGVKPRRSLGKYEIPDAALTMAEDILIIELTMELLRRIDPSSIGPNRNEARSALRRLQILLNACRDLAKDKLRQTYLSGGDLKQRQKPQTLANVWQILRGLR